MQEQPQNIQNMLNRLSNTYKGRRDSGLMLDKVPPQSRDIEEVLLGSMMLDKEAVAEVIDILKPESFYVEAHQHLFEAIHNLFSKSQPVDIITVTDQLRKNGKLDDVGGAYYVSQLTMRVGSTANIEHYARIVSEKYILRELIKNANEIIKDAYEDTTDVFELLDKAEKGLFGIAENNLRRSYDSMSNLVPEALKQIENMSKDETGVIGVPSGFVGLDRLTSGWQRSDLIILAARPAMGKCLGKGTKVLMYDGSLKKVEDIRIGDLLMGDDSTPRRVLSLARGREMMYWVRQKYGIDYRVNQSHILSFKQQQQAHCPNQQLTDTVLNISVNDFLHLPDNRKNNCKGYKVSVHFDPKNLPTAPYLLGLGMAGNAFAHPNGNAQSRTAANGSLTTRNATAAIALQQTHASAGIDHIPQVYLINSTQNRLELLAGLIDSTGYYNTAFNYCEIWVRANKSLAEQIKFLCDSLGFRTQISASNLQEYHNGTDSNNNANDNNNEPIYTVRLSGNIAIIPTQITQLSAADLSATNNADCWRTTDIVVEKDREDDYYGFEIDGNRLFLLEDMTVTHNTAMTLSLARNAAIDFKKPIAFFSLEMSSLQLVNRLISAETGISADKLKRADLQPHEWMQLTTKVETLATAPIFIDDTPAINIFELRAKCRRLKMQHDIQMIVIDYLQLMSGTSSDKKGSNREQEISLISRSLKSIAKELNVPVIALSQLSREVEKRGGDKRPQLSDLRESGSIEQDADMVIFLYRPEYYGFDHDENGNPTQGVTEIIVSKHRNGALGTVKVKFISQNAKFVDYDAAEADFAIGNDVTDGIVTLKSRMNDKDTVSGFDDEPPF